jgi:hypothetical protein
VTSLGTRTVHISVAAFHPRVYVALILFGLEAHVLISYRLHDCTATFRNTRTICNPQNPAEAANQLLRVEVLIFQANFILDEVIKGLKLELQLLND